MISFEQAVQIRNREQNSPGAPAGDFIEHESFWWLRDARPHVGWGGMIIDRADGHPSQLGGGLEREVVFYAHERGFRHKSYLFRITAVRDVERTLRLLWDIRYIRVRDHMAHLPLDLSFSWACYPFLPRIVEADYFDYEFSVSSCDYAHCSAIGSRLLISQPAA